MACGCSRNRAKKITKESIMLSFYRIRRAKCNSCQYAKKYPYAKNPKYRLLTSKSICKKSKKVLFIALKNKKYRCPIRRFKS